MSAEAPTPHPEMPRRRSRVVKSNRTQILLFSILTLILTDEAKTPSVVEPFNLSTGHNNPSMIQRRGCAMHQRKAQQVRSAELLNASPPNLSCHAGWFRGPA